MRRKVEKSTNELEFILAGVHEENIRQYLIENKESLVQEERPFSAYMRERIRAKGLQQQDVFLQADISERYGYKLLSGEKRTRQRDVILRICYGAQLTLQETQHALKLYGMSPLYVKIPRDVVLMIAFRDRRGSVIEVNEILEKQGMEQLRTTGAQC